MFLSDFYKHKQRRITTNIETIQTSHKLTNTQTFIDETHLMTPLIIGSSIILITFFTSKSYCETTLHSVFKLQSKGISFQSVFQRFERKMGAIKYLCTYVLHFRGESWCYYLILRGFYDCRIQKFFRLRLREVNEYNVPFVTRKSHFVLPYW